MTEKSCLKITQRCEMESDYLSVCFMSYIPVPMKRSFLQDDKSLFLVTADRSLDFRCWSLLTYPLSFFAANMTSRQLLKINLLEYLSRWTPLWLLLHAHNYYTIVSLYHFDAKVGIVNSESLAKRTRQGCVLLFRSPAPPPQITGRRKEYHWQFIFSGTMCPTDTRWRVPQMYSHQF